MPKTLAQFQKKGDGLDLSRRWLIYNQKMAYVQALCLLSDPVLSVFDADREIPTRG